MILKFWISIPVQVHLDWNVLVAGAKHVTFIERNFQIYKNLLENIKSLGVENQCKVVKSEAIDFSKRLPEKQYDLILADPPFFKEDIYEVVKNLKANNYLKDRWNDCN